MMNSNRKQATPCSSSLRRHIFSPFDLISRSKSMGIGLSFRLFWMRFGHFGPQELDNNGRFDNFENFRRLTLKSLTVLYWALECSYPNRLCRIQGEF
ncbi:unnamed protein product [Prunus armeniaca]